MLAHHEAESWCILELVLAGWLFLDFFWGRKNRNGNHGCRFSKKGVLEERMKRMRRESWKQLHYGAEDRS